jgi:hypothetical protein
MGAILIFIVVIVSPLWPYIIGAAWTPTSRRVVDKMLSMAKVTPEDTVYDLGSGDGRILVAASKTYKAQSIGIEADPIRVLWSRLAILRFGLRKKAKIVWGNLFNKDIGEATVVTLFLYNKTNAKLKPKLRSELKPGSRVVSYYWPIKGWKPIHLDREDKIYVYEIGESDKIEEW